MFSTVQILCSSITARWVDLLNRTLPSTAMDKTSLTEKIDAVLPQTQCGQCGYAGCKPYAVAIVNGEADINQCPPGGVEGIDKLAKLLHVKPKPLNTAHGITKPKSVAVINEATCIGCTLCIQACPVDAIIGAAKQMHTIVAEECTGCELCIAPCPVDCISLVPVEETQDDDGFNRSSFMRYYYAGKRKNDAQRKAKHAADRARRRHEHRQLRMERDAMEKLERLGAKQIAATMPIEADAKKAAIAAAVARAKAKKAQSELKK